MGRRGLQARGVGAFAAITAFLAIVPTAAATPTDLAIAMTHTDVFTAGDVSRRYTITVTNVGDGLAEESPMVIDQLPTGLKPVLMAGGSWSCASPTGPCTSVHTPVLPGASFPPLTVEVDVALTAPPQVTNYAAISSPEDVNEANNAAAEATTILPASPLAVTRVKPLDDGSVRVGVAVPGPGAVVADDASGPSLISVDRADVKQPKTQRLRLRPARALTRALARGGSKRVGVEFTFKSVDGVTLTERRRIRFRPDR